MLCRRTSRKGMSEVSRTGGIRCAIDLRPTRRSVALGLSFDWPCCESHSRRYLAAPPLVDLGFRLREVDKSESARREPGDVTAERSVVVPVTAEALDPPCLVVEVAAYLAVAAVV